ncbi:acyl-CoA dehydrogenase family protein [Falsiroseomonas sp.]|uniref:acyl-CoA dehydrogenase family protein n=1 Tax=Falsiroseomonas sp. TaxID=2870721 RepID=UPI00271F5C80|nr:acyl-CoA dehydrogenase family protein [Falsiroseomonas sp.]MDO9499300.1 acyl-CoA dehydrogenase family protein [Falsiroseomonas sp.]
MATGSALGAWELPQELQMLRDTVRRFMREEVRPAEEGLPHDATRVAPDVLKGLQAKARKLGLWQIESQSEWGGAGLGLLGQAVVAEESSQCKMGAYIPACHAFGWDPPNVIFRGTEAQIRRYAGPVMETGDKSFVAISEPSGGSDPGRSIQTRAERRGDRYILNGTKTWISGVGDSSWGVLFARTGPSKGRDGITAFIVEKSFKGFSYKPIPVIRSYAPYEISLQDCEVPVENRLGEEGEGFKIAEDWLIHARVPYSAAVIGIAQAALALAIDWVNSRETFRSKLADKQAIQWMVADSEIELRAARLLVWQAAWRGDLGHNIKMDTSVAKVFATETAGRVVDRCIQMFGGLGVAQEMPLERWYRELRIKRLGEGPSEVHRMVVAREMLSGRGNA